MGDTLLQLGGAIILNLEKAELPTNLVEWFLGHKDRIPEAIRRGFVCPEELKPEIFSLLVDLGIITVPPDYDHATALAGFLEKNRNKFYGIDDNISDANFPNPSRVLKPGQKLHVRAFQQIVPGPTTSEERLAFLATQKAVHTGAQGASLVFEQKRDQLPKDRWYVSFDEPSRLWKDAAGHHGVAYVFAYSDGVFSDGVFDFSLGFFEHGWYDHHALLCFCDVE